MLCHHISTHLASCDFLKLDFLLLPKNSVSDKVILGKNLLGPGMADWVVDNVEGWLAVDKHLHRGSSLLPNHLCLKLSQEARLCRCSRELHVLALTCAQAGIGNELGLPADSSTSREESVAPSTATSVGTGEVARITVAPELSRLPLLETQPLPSGAL